MGNKSNSSDWIVGVWELDAFELLSKLGPTRYPLGRSPIGRLIYTENGFMSANICKAKRVNFKSDNLLNASMLEWSIAASDYTCYSGKYYIEDDIIYHEVDMSLFPNFVGTQIKRNFLYEAPVLTLSFDLETNNEALGYTAKLVWHRV